MIRFISLFLTLLASLAFAADRSAEIREEMWNSSDKTFALTDVPPQWAGKSAVYLAKLNRFEFRKAVMASYVRRNQYNHYRIKLLDQNAITRYAEMTYDESIGNTYQVYVGFKIIKPNGKEQIIDISRAVKMQRESRGRKYGYFKLAIPGLEPGDILDYYICEEESILTTAKLYFFDPVIHCLTREYPVANYKLQFRASRKCYINLKSLNGAPALKVVSDEKDDEEFYSFEGTDLDGSDDQRWVFPYRDLPTIKFRAAYAYSGGLADYFGVLLGEPRVAKTKVLPSELAELTEKMMRSTLSIFTLPKEIKDTKVISNPFQAAEKIYYSNRHDELINYAERNEFMEYNPPRVSEIEFIKAMNTELKAKKIPHDIVIGMRRHISTIDDVIMENELDWLIRIKKGKEFLYLTAFEKHTPAGFLHPLLQGTEAYVVDGLVPPAQWAPKKVTLPTAAAQDNLIETYTTATLSADLDAVKLVVKKAISGAGKEGYQEEVLDYYDYEPEEFKRYPRDKTSLKVSKLDKNATARKNAYMSKRTEKKMESWKPWVESEFTFKVKDIELPKVENTGRFDLTTPFSFQYTCATEEIVQRAGTNHIVDVGKLLEEQTKIKPEELNRATNIYLEYPRKIVAHLTVVAPAGYTWEGTEQLLKTVVNKYGEFSAAARVEGNTLIIETTKQYSAVFVPKADWPKVVEFLNAALEYSDQKALLVKSK